MRQMAGRYLIRFGDDDDLSVCNVIMCKKRKKNIKSDSSGNCLLFFLQWPVRMTVLTYMSGVNKKKIAPE